MLDLIGASGVSGAGKVERSFLNKALDGNIPATQRMLRIMLNNDKIKVRKVGVQQWLQNLYGHSAQLDILAEDENGTQFNVEIQRNDEGASAKRARFYGGRSKHG